MSLPQLGKNTSVVDHSKHEKSSSAEGQWLASLRSGKLSTGPNGVVYVRRGDARTDATRHAELRLNEYYLPATKLAPACTIADDEEASRSILLAIDHYLAGNQDGRCEHRTAVHKASTLAKLFEYCRIEGVYAPRDLSQDHFDELARLLANGGWGEVLRLKERCSKLLEEGWQRTWVVNEADDKPIGLTLAFRRALRTNCSGSELNCVRGQVEIAVRGVQTTTDARPRGRLTVSQMRQYLEAINELSYIEQPYRIPFAPFSFAMAQKLGRQSSRTGNLSIDQAAPLLAAAMTWVFTKSETYLRILERLLERGARAVGVNEANQQSDAFDDAKVQEWLVALLGPEMSCLSSGAGQLDASAVRFNRATSFLLDACFIVVAVMNARRKDEIQHRRYGLHSSSASVVSEELGIYECEFYILKTTQRYVTFYANEATFRAHKVLCDIRFISKRFAGPDQSLEPREDTLFRAHRAARGGLSAKPAWHAFVSRHRHGHGFVETVAPAFAGQRLTAHMFRRFYAVIFFYRYENATLLALSQQLCHLDMERTRQYVVDAASTEKSRRLSVGIATQRRVHESHNSDLIAMLEEVGEEKFSETIEAILAGRRCSGGFERFVRRAQDRFARAADYRVLDTEHQTKSVTEAFLQHGYRPLPMVHGECMAGSCSSRRRGHCYSKSLGDLDRSRAGPKPCNGCVFNHVSEGYVSSLAGLVDDLERDMSRVAEKSVQWMHLRTQRDEAREVLATHRTRIYEAQS